MDIEDLYTEVDVIRPAEHNGAVKARLRIRKHDTGIFSGDTLTAVPESHRIFVQTWGCAHNTSDSEYMAGLLAQYGYQVTLGGSISDAPEIAEHTKGSQQACECTSGPDANCCQQEVKNAVSNDVSGDQKAKNDAHLWVLNSCTVKGPAEDHFRNAVLAGLRLGKKLVVAGCVPQSRPGADYLKGVSIIGVQQIDRIVEVVDETLQEGVKELWLTSEDLGAYGRDLDRATSTYSCPSMAARFPNFLTLADLLSGLVRIIPEGCMLRLGMTNPPYILEQLQEIAEVLSHSRVYAFLHIPVQSGSDAVLDCMKREYTVDEFSHVVSYLREHVPPPPLPPCASENTINGSGSLTIATDIICGFPNETDADFEETVKLIDRFRFPVLYINQFFARPGTPAANMTRKATTAEVKKRTRQLHDLFRTYRPYEGRQGALVRVLVTETSHDGRFWVGHTKAYEQVLVPKVPEVYGRIILVRITECDKFFMRSEIVDSGPLDSLVFMDPFSSSDGLPSLRPLIQKDRPKHYIEKSPNKPSEQMQTNANCVLLMGLMLLLAYLLLKLCESHGYLQWNFTT